MRIGPEAKRLTLRCAVVWLGAIFFASLNPARAANPPADAGKYTGPGSCSSTSCHGSVKPRADNRIFQNEYSIWAVKDKHAKAYDALTGPIGERMGRILGLGKSEQAAKCLACHALDVPAEARAKTFDLSEGVSCESCHGPASAWLGPHTTRNWTHEQSVAAGMYDTRNLARRTEKCLTCHLGTQEKFVDHEMIAAGHPDLYFELDSFSAVMPRHWKTPRESAPGVPAENDAWAGVRDWGTGQAVQLRASMERIAWRAKGKNWPEYSELQCFACHHSLTAPEQSWRQERGYAGRRPGDPPWNGSRYAVFRELAHQVDNDAASRLDDQVAQIGEVAQPVESRPRRGGSGVGQRRVAFESARRANRDAALRRGDDAAPAATDFEMTPTKFRTKASAPPNRPPWRSIRCSSPTPARKNSRTPPTFAPPSTACSSSSKILRITIPPILPARCAKWIRC